MLGTGLDKLSDEGKAARSRENQKARANRRLSKRHEKTVRKLDKRVKLIAAYLGRDLSKVELTTDLRMDIIRAGYERIGKPYKGTDSTQSMHSCAGFVVHRMGVKKQPRKRNFVTTKEFLESYEWRKLRMQALKKYGPVCMCCGGRPPNVQINVDHIKPRKRYPELALDINNLQVLCHECNHGKGNWDETDWREPSLSVVMGERMEE